MQPVRPLIPHLSALAAALVLVVAGQFIDRLGMLPQPVDGAALVDTVATLEPADTQTARLDISIYSPSLPKLPLTLDARAVNGAAQDTKLPVGWVGSNLVAYAVASDQNIGPEPLYVQRIDSPRRILVANDALAAAPAPSSARLAILRGSMSTGINPQTSQVSLQIAAFARRHTAPMSLPTDSSTVATGFDDGQAALGWSADGSRVAAAWMVSSGVQVAICTPSNGHCVTAVHNTDLGLHPQPLKTRVGLGWVSNQVVLLEVTVLTAHGRSALVTLPAGDPTQRPVLALAPGTHLAQPEVEEFSVAPIGGNAGFVVGSTGGSARWLQIAHLRGIQLMPEQRTVALAPQRGGLRPLDVFAAAPEQAWSSDGQVLTYADVVTRQSRRSGSVWRITVSNGRRQELFSNSAWVATRSVAGGTEAVATGPRDAGSCPDPPVAEQTPASGQPTTSFPKQASVQRAVLFYASMRRQAFRLADGSCLSSVAGRAALSADLGHIAGLAQAGEFATVSSSVKPQSIRVNMAAGTATEVAVTSTGETDYHDGQSVRAVAARTVTVRYSLRLRHLPKSHGQPQSRWIVMAARQAPR